MMKVMGLLRPLLFFIGGGVSLLILFVGGNEITAQRISLGTLVAFFGYLGWLVWPMMSLGWVVSLYQRGTASLDRINKILNTQPGIFDVASDVSARLKPKGKIEFKNLTFVFPPANGEKVSTPTLHNINLTIEPGTRLGIIGPTGSGKTTLVSLIPRIYPTDSPGSSGQLLIDGIDINLWPLRKLRRSIGFVPQETFLFSDTLAANINFSSDETERNKIIHSAQLAVLHGDTESFPKGYETVLGERGITLSGGQKQRAALARAILKDPQILILDDATSSVDTGTEENIFHNLMEVLPGRTSLIISHRVASIKGCDKIIYLDQGRIVEEGEHEQLMTQNGPYAALFKRQLAEAELEQM
jgi:ATP-binding cassette subfamily B protein